MQNKVSNPAIIPDSVFLKAAIEIGDQLAGLAVTDGKQTYWRVTSKITEKASYEHNDIYSGCSGIGLFFLELYKHTHREKYLRLARRSIRTATTRELTQSISPSFICGRIGVAYALVKLYETTTVQLYRKQALMLVRSCRGIYSKHQEYLDGNSGTILALLYIHAICKEPWLLEMVNDYTEHVLQNIHHDMTGIYWDRESFDIIRPLCGFSHGVSGIGFVLLELGQYFKNPTFYDIAEQAFAYENTFFSTTHSNWPDFRLSLWKPEHIAAMEIAYTNNNLNIFYEIKYMSAWCHGAPGIGLSRISAFQRTNNQTYLRDVDRAVLATRNTNLDNISLCHGLAGHIEVFLESYLAFGRSRDWDDAVAFGKRLLQRWGETQTATKSNEALTDQLDLGLFTGIAGAGYNLLRLHGPHATSSILAPHLPVSLSGELDSELSSLQITKAGARSLLIEKDARDTAGIGQLKRQMITRYPSNGFLYIKYRLAQKSARRLLQLDDDQLMESILLLDPDCVVHIESTNEGTLLRYAIKGIEQESVSSFCYVVLTTFEKPRRVRDVVEIISAHYNNAQLDERLLQAKILEQIRQALHALFLWESRTT